MREYREYRMLLIYLGAIGAGIVLGALQRGQIAF